MTSIKHVTFAVAVIAAVFAVSGGAQANTCRTAGGLAQMPTHGLAEFMAEAALKNAIANQGWTAAGAIKMSCKDDTFTTTCTARRRACD
jgi:hypothetical protein